MELYRIVKIDQPQPALWAVTAAAATAPPQANAGSALDVGALCAFFGFEQLAIDVDHFWSEIQIYNLFKSQR